MKSCFLNLIFNLISKSPNFFDTFVHKQCDVIPNVIARAAKINRDIDNRLLK